jgi:hypothetical protein
MFPVIKLFESIQLADFKAYPETIEDSLMVTSVEVLDTVKAEDMPVPTFDDPCNVVATFVELLDKLVLVKPNVPVPPREIF